ncbi:MAG: hypothetical protein JXA96_10005 [Sedimentisphaerales bacterium]|nr:hypothetical protein [Sedimentisphaerales bacterium]
MRPSEDIENLVKKNRYKFSYETREKVFENVLEEIEKNKKQEAGVQTPALWRIIMKSSASKLVSAAAVIIIAIFAGMHFTGNPFGATYTFADILKPILNAQTVEFDIIIGDEETGVKIHDIVKGSRIRRTTEGINQAFIIDFESSKMLTLETKSQTAILIDLNNLGQVPENYFDRLKDIVQVLESDPNFVIEELGEMEIEGQQSVGFIASSPEAEIIIWADSETGLPVRIEQDEKQFKSICKNFKFNLQLDDSLFSMDIPEGYSLAEINIDLKAGSETEFIEGLGLYAEIFNDGVFPEDISVESFVKNSQKIGRTLSRLDMSDSEKLAISNKLSRFIMFIRFFEGEGKWHYAGVRVEMGDAEKAIFWYKPKESQTWRVVYGDLSVQDVSEEDLPETELSDLQSKILESSKQWEDIAFTGTEIDSWYVTSPEKIVAYSNITLTKISQDANVMYIKLPYASATLDSVILNDEQIPFGKIIDDRYELFLPISELQKGTSIVECAWSLPLETLKTEDGGYRTKLQGLIPVESFELSTVLEPGCGFEHSLDPSKSQVNYFKTSSFFSLSESGSCGFLMKKIE